MKIFGDILTPIKHACLVVSLINILSKLLIEFDKRGRKCAI